MVWEGRLRRRRGRGSGRRDEQTSTASLFEHRTVVKVRSAQEPGVPSLTPKPLRRRRQFNVIEMQHASDPGDAILSKLEWAKQSGESERQLRDAMGVLELNPSLDRQYIERWAVALGVDDLWRRLTAGR
jgi:hypothetical protein